MPGAPRRFPSFCPRRQVECDTVEAFKRNQRARFPLESLLTNPRVSYVHTRLRLFGMSDAHRARSRRVRRFALHDAAPAPTDELTDQAPSPVGGFFDRL